MISQHTLERVALPVLILAFLVGLYLFSRVTVDDAYITWRYGKNLVEAGIWAYNPSTFDLTQAYTNPLFAALSIIPAFFGWDVLFFFKILALLSLAGPYAYLRRVATHKRSLTLLYLLFLALPATLIHAFAGLETFFFTGLMGMLCVALARQAFRHATLFALILLFIRPEAWLLVGLVPAYIAYIAVKHPQGFGVRLADLGSRAALQKPLLACGVLGGALALYFAFHWWHFGYALPNTFYVKAGAAFSLSTFGKNLLFLAPALALLAAGRAAPLLLFMALFYLPVAYHYAASDLQMNYVERFAYHIFAPVYLVLAYLVSSEARPLVLGPPLRALRAALPDTRRLALVLLLLSFALFAAKTVSSGLVLVLNNTQRFYTVYGAFGKLVAQTKDRYNITGFALSDAGVGPFHAGVPVLDMIGLGSALIAHQGPTQAVIEAYNPTIALLRINENGVMTLNAHKRALLQWVQHKSYQPRCDLYLRESYSLRIYSAQDMPEFKALCAESLRQNAPSDPDFFLRHNLQPPWRYWRE